MVNYYSELRLIFHEAEAAVRTLAELSSTLHLIDCPMQAPCQRNQHHGVQVLLKSLCQVLDSVQAAGGAYMRVKDLSA